MKTPAEVEAYLHQHIPISAAMGVRVLASDARGVTLAAPLAPNINHRATAFGGSVSAVAILAAWSWLHVATTAAGQAARLVIQSNSMEYLAPISDAFEARCEAPEPRKFEQFIRTFQRHGKARIELRADLTCNGLRVASLRGDYVAVRTE